GTSSGISSGDVLILPERHPACRRREARPGSCGDEEGPFGFDDQVVDPKLPRAAAVKSRGGERRGKARTMIRAGMVEGGERKRTAAILAVQRLRRIVRPTISMT